MAEKEIDKLYDSNSLEIMRTAENALGQGLNRVQEIKNFARKGGVKRIGIAHCVSFSKEAAAVKQYLSDEFEVYSIDCKYGRITKYEMFGDDGNRIMCNPAGQAEFLKENNTQLNVSMGLCVGHDMVFNKKSNAPVSTLVVKDRVNKHSPIEGVKSISQAE